MRSSSAREWGPTTLGRQAVGDPNLVRELRHGHSPTLATADQLLAFMEGFDEAGVDPVSSRSDRLRDSSPRERRGREMTRTRVQEMEVPIRIVRLPAVQARTGLGRSTIYVRLAEGSFPRPVQLGARCRLDRGGGGRVDPQADRVEPRRGRVIGASQRETKENTMQPLLRGLYTLVPKLLFYLEGFGRAVVDDGTEKLIGCGRDTHVGFQFRLRRLMGRRLRRSPAWLAHRTATALLVWIGHTLISV